ncbi:MAG: type II toxin-antitoxin system YafQ family toxin, partial [Prolixibacteraceae bacterium]|nr:type II toxin-antitoxin system YafQ family toxin [Prolixibacteraceae bacterium]
IDILQSNGKLPPKYKAHVLSGQYAGLWECHLKPDWLIIWGQNDKVLTLLFMATGTHTDLF